MSEPAVLPNGTDLSDEGGFSDLHDFRSQLQGARAQAPEQVIPSSPAPALEAGARSAISAAGGAAGFAAGFTAGLPGTAIPVVGPAVPLVTGLMGMIGGGYASDRAASTFLRSAEQMPPEQRSRAIFGENIGGTAGFAVPVAGAARSGFNFVEKSVGKYLNAIIDTARRMPKTFGVVQATGAASSGAGGVVAQQIDPDDPTSRFIGEFTAGLANPVYRASQLYSVVTNTMATASARYGVTAQQNLVGKQILAAMQEAGEDPELVVQVLKRQMPAEYEKLLTAGQKTGSDVLIGFERGLYEHSGKFGNDAREKVKAVMDIMKVQMGMLAQSGDPKALAEIAKLRQASYEMLIDTRIQRASTDVMLSISRLTRGGAIADKPVISANAKAVMNRVADEIGDIENQLWEKTKATRVPVPLTNLQRVRQELLEESAEFLKGEKIPPYLEKAIRAAESKNKTSFDYDPESFVINESTAPASLSSHELVDYRRALNSDMREAVIAGRDDDARRLFKLQEAVLMDMETAYSKMANTAYEEARTFTKAKHDVFSRTFVGDTDAMSKRGDRIPAEMVLDRAFAGGAVAADIKLRDLEASTRFLSERGLGSPGAVEEMLDAQEQFYRIVVGASVTKDGRVDPAKVREFISKNDVLLKRVPFNEIKTDLMTTLKSEQGLRRLEAFAKNRSNDIGKKSAFAQIVKSDPVAYASRVLMDTQDQEGKLVSMFNLAKKGGAGFTPDEGVRSARASILSAAINRAMGEDGQVDLGAVRGLLFSPRVVGQKSVAQVMTEQGVLDADHVAAMRQMFDVLDGVEKSRRLGQPIGVKSGEGEIGLILAAKIAGSKATTVMQRATGASGSELIVHGAVARAMEQVVAKIPQAKTKDMAVLMFNDPQLLATVLQRNMKSDAASDMKKVRFLNAWLLQSGLTLANSERDFEQPAPPPQMFSLPR